MNKIVIGIGVVLSAYLIYTSVNNEEGEAPVSSEKMIENQEITEDTPVLEEVIPYVNTEEYLDSRYSLLIESDLAKTNQEFTFTSDYNFELRRYVIVPEDDQRDSTTTGTYSMKKNEVTLTFELERDLDVFIEDIIILNMRRNGNLQYGPFELIKE